jgi:predicted ATP-binding protein involved in virulence
MGILRGRCRKKISFAQSFKNKNMDSKNIIEVHENVYVHLMNKYPDLRFTLRQIDRSERLSKGYWFTGNDNYLAFSFWSGTDWRNKTSNIFFSIDNDGTCWLNFVANDDDLEGKKSSFLKDTAELLGMFKRPKRAEDPTKQDWVKGYDGNNYIELLDTFIKGDKKTIDTLVKVGKADFFESISDSDFKRWKKKIDEVRIKSSSKLLIEEVNLIKKIRLKELIIENISLFNGVQALDFHERLTCIIGWNGTGKTSILRSIVLGFTGNEQDESLSTDNSKLDKLQRLLKIRGELENSKGEAKYVSSGYINLAYEINGEQTNNKVLFKTENNKPVIKDDGAFKSIKDKIYEGLFLGFAQEQSSENIRKEDSPELPNVEDAIGLLYGEADKRFRKFAAWLRKVNNLSNAKKAEGKSNLKEEQLFDKVFEVISKIVGEKKDRISLHKIVVTNGKDDPIWVKIGEDSEPILLELVSQGFDNIFGWAGYLITRLSEVADVLDIKDFMEVPAIVLIDEIDTYLHPQWQSRILAVLVDMFPNIQFVVTTHSPNVVSSVQSDKILIYRCEKGDDGVNIVHDIDTEATYGASTETITEEVLLGSAREPKISEVMRQLRNAVLGNRIEEADSLVAKLSNELKVKIDKHPSIKSLVTLLNTKKRMAGV